MVYLFKVIRLKKIIKFILIILWMLVIFYFSADRAPQSTHKSRRTIVKISEIVKGRKLTQKEKDIVIDKYTVVVRKSAHFILYFVLGLLVYSLLLEYSLTTRKSIIISIIIVFLYACSDEIHQLFVSGRSGELLDILIDTLAGSLASYLYYLVRRKLNG